MIRYAGYDPTENDFSMIDLTPMHWWCWTSEHRPRRQPGIDPRRAAELRATGLKWREVADALTHEQGRAIRFTCQSVVAAVRRASKEDSNES